MPQITLAGTGETFDCEAGDTVLRAGLRAGLGLPYECNVGACGQCRFQLIKGELEPLTRTFAALSDRDVSRGRSLACQARPISDCTVHLRLQERYVPQHRPVRQSARLESIRTLTRDIRAFTFRTALPAKFMPGQYALLHLPAVDAPRPLSMANLPNPTGLWQFMIREVPGGQASGYLFGRAAEGDEIALDGAYGTAFYRPSSAEVVCIAGGSGIAPALSIARAAAADAACRHIEFFYGARTPADLCHTDIERLPKRADLSVACHAVVSGDVGTAWRGPTGLLHEYLARTLFKPHPSARFYLAGPPAMVEAVESVLMGPSFGIERTRIHYDRFF